MRIKVWTPGVMRSGNHCAAILPIRASAGAAGYDISTPYDVVIQPGEQEMINTGIIFGIPDGYVLDIRPRSGLATKGWLSIPNSPGTLDSDYCGPMDILKVCLRNEGTVEKVFLRGDRIAQVLLTPVLPMEFDVQEAMTTGDSRGGFGSTGGVSQWTP